ncbi:hypothetical protein [Rhizobium leguminosarum]|uniref:hypothetical protein n=1 Tax=Rhizobium leguminosarum TaxID=384 RepID=UPI003F9B0D15
MIIVYFEYGAKVFFFGVTAGKQTTHCSPSRDEVANELYTLQRNEWTEGLRYPNLKMFKGWRCAP